ncbi:VanZ family protein [Streptomyces sp. NPDC094049]|uniref:VanZ family protein n=1 Tax=Streptomyces sp. NPDC094049 TaxID=3154987 RepID=UPI00332DB96F
MISWGGPRRRPKKSADGMAGRAGRGVGRFRAVRAIRAASGEDLATAATAATVTAAGTADRAGAVPSPPETDGAPPKRARPVRSGPGRTVRALVAVLALAGMVAFAVVLARLTLGESPASVPLTHDNLTPGRSIRAYLHQPGFVETVKQLGGNVALGVPFGLLLPLLSRRARGAVRVALLTAATMLIVELVQGALITGRAFDIDDALLNTAGALLGYFLLGRRLGRAVHPRTRGRWWRRSEAGSV